jgi:PKD repeat protein
VRPGPWTSHVAGGVAIAVVAMSGAVAARAGEPGPGQVTVAIQGPHKGWEGQLLSFAADLPDRPLRHDAAGFSPPIPSDSGGALPVAWSAPVDFVWDFGDGTGPVTVHDRSAASHAYAKEGSFTITVGVKSGDTVVARARHEVVVTNHPPRELRVAAVEVDPATQTVELSGTADDVASDRPLRYHWEYGDGGQEEGEDLWEPRHVYVAPGTYHPRLTVSDSSGAQHSASGEVVVTGVAEAAGAQRESLAKENATEVVTSGLKATLSGDLAGPFVGEMRAFKGLHVQRIRDGVCRFVFTAWDNARLGYLMAVLDLPGVPPGGARFHFDKPLFALVLDPKAPTYETEKKFMVGTAGAGGLGGLVDRMTGGITQVMSESKKHKIDENVGLDIGAREPQREQVPTASSSPFGLEKRQSFKVVAGNLDLSFVPGERATATYDLKMQNTDRKPPPGLRAFSFDGSFALDLAAARRDGVIHYEGCEPRQLEVESTSPVDGEQHVYTLRPPVRVDFNLPLDPDSIDAERFQLTYPEPSTGQPVAVPARLLRDRAAAWLVPERNLQGGVRYTARVKTGDEGARARGGATIPDADGSGWYTWTFATRIDFETKGGPGTPLLACTLYQTTRDAPLVPCKPAVARVYASWKGAESVHPSARVKEFEARVVLWDSKRHEVASTHHRFVRPDLWDTDGVKDPKAEHTAQIFGWTPSADDGDYTVALQIETKPGKHIYRYFAACPTTHWDLAPVITVDYLALVVGEWEKNPAELQAALPVMRRLIAAAEEYALQLFPLAAIKGGPLRVFQLEKGQQHPPSWCDSACFRSSVKAQLQRASDADIVVGFAPQEVLGGGSTGPRLDGGHPAVIVSLAGRSTAWFPRYVEGLVHEIGHALGLDHIPTVSPPERKRAENLRKGDEPLLYRGIEGFRLTADGGGGWNKSSSEGNEQGPWLVQLMYPTTIPTDEAFIADHSYRDIQRFFGKLHWQANQAASTPCASASR